MSFESMSIAEGLFLIAFLSLGFIPLGEMVRKAIVNRRAEIAAAKLRHPSARIIEAPDYFCTEVGCFEVLPSVNWSGKCSAHYAGKHRDYSIEADERNDYREDAVAIHGEWYAPKH